MTWRSYSVSAMLIVSSAYLMLVIVTPFTLIPLVSSKASRISSSLYILNRIGARWKPCRKPFLILKLLDSPLKVLTTAVWFQYRSLINLFSSCGMSYFSRTSNNLLCLIRSKAFVQSMKQINIDIFTISKFSLDISSLILPFWGPRCSLSGPLKGFA